MKHFLFALLAFPFGAQAQTGNIITVNLENDAVTRFLEEVTYTSSEDTSQIINFNVEPPMPMLIRCCSRMPTMLFTAKESIP